MKRFNPWLVVSTLLLQIIFLVIVNIELCIQPNVAQLKPFLSFANLVLIVLSLLVIVSIRHIFNNYRQQIEDNLLKFHLSDVHQLLAALQEEKYNTRRHFETIGSLLQFNQANKALDYTDKVTSQLSKSSDLPPLKHLGLYALLASRQKIAESKEIKFKMNILCNLDNMFIASWDLCAICGNLLDNALDAALASTGRREVSFQISQEDGWYMISVANSGPRLKPAQKSRLFEPGYTTKGSAARGFGLYAVRRIVDQYGGAIDLITDTLTTFTIYLPKEGATRLGKRTITSIGS